ncbi:unnamed protein product [Urochloa decumbens]|uniref:Receptor-like serine/threonine-protein kinase n=1 Tax=Urochloa decumbens TaxID=240449 RepID=A0ABC9DIT7_9POAL
MRPLMSPAIVHLALFLHVILLHPSMLLAQTSRNNLTAGGDTLIPPYYITSPSGDFAFGFRPLDSKSNSSSFLLAIWFFFDGTVVWFATDASSGSAIVAAGQSVLSVSTTGQLSLSNPGENNPLLWSPSSDHGPVLDVSHVVLNDTGNLQFVGGAGGSSVVWESFQYPTDTLLPGQSMLPGTKLQSRSADTGFSLGQFSFIVQGDGNIVMYKMNTAADSGGPVNAYWSSGTCCAGNTTLFFDVNPPAYLYFILSDGSRGNLTTPQPLPSTAGFYQHATLDPDGLFRVYIRPKNTGGKKGNDTAWSIMKQIPSVGCRSLTNGQRGMCGPNSYCIDLPNKRIDCACPSGYVFLDSQNRYKGCIPTFLPDSCDGKNHTAEFEVQDSPSANWVSSVSYKMHTFVTEEQCRHLCLNSCSCAVALFNGNNCSEVGMLVAGWQENGTTMRTLVKVRTKSPPVQMLPYILIVALAVLLLVTTCTLLVHCYITKKARKNYLGTRVFTHKELCRATNGFSNLLGEGGFGKVYRGTVKSLQPPEVAVKDLGGCKVEYKEKEFENEVRSTGQIHHKNLVRMIGYCKEGVHRMLVFEYMQGGTLADTIARSERPCWSFLAEAAIGIAKGLEYLHEGCKSKIIHCDIKPDNILFDDKHIPRITDFGIAKLLGDQKTQKTVINTIVGTKPYIAPEWFDGVGKVDSKVDVYSFGVVLLEIICCKRATEQPTDAQAPSTMFPLRAWVESLIRGGNAELLVQEESEALAYTESVERFARIAIWCLQKDPSTRPTMRKVVQMLEGEVEVDPLPDPPMPSGLSAVLSSGSDTRHSSSMVHAFQVE